MTSPLHTEKTIDNAIIFMQRHDLCTVPAPEVQCGHIYGGRPVRIGQFVFDCYAHDTGNSVYVYLLAGLKSLPIIRTTFWHSERYTFNDSLWREDGEPWAEALNEAMNTMRLTVAGHVLGAIKNASDSAAARLRELQAERDFFGAQFKAA